MATKTRTCVTQALAQQRSDEGEICSPTVVAGILLTGVNIFLVAVEVVALAVGVVGVVDGGDLPVTAAL